jgi:hypothetical protein
MARLNVEDTIDYERELVFETFRDNLEDLVEYLPDIEDIEVESREEVDEETVKLVNKWSAEEEDIPSLAKKFIEPEMLQWTDYATWRQDEWVCDWQIEVGFLQDAISCEGQNRYLSEDGTTKIHIDGDLEVDASEIPGVPSLVANKVGSAVENFVTKLIEPNLSDVNRGVERYLDGQTQ